MGPPDAHSSEVVLIVSPIGGIHGSHWLSKVAGVEAAIGYHSSVAVAGEEFVFSHVGITLTYGMSTHGFSSDTQHISMGFTKHTGSELVEFFDPIFPAGHYDLLRKNCNSFTDCALYYLCGKRLDRQYRRMEQLGKLADEGTGLVQMVSAGEYKPNRLAVSFDVDSVIRLVDMELDPAARDSMAEICVDPSRALAAKSEKLMTEMSEDLLAMHGDDWWASKLPEAKTTTTM